MKLKKIILNNIRSYKNQEIEFPSGSTLLSGDIGAGKTSILLGIEFALFGLQPGQRGISLLRAGKNQGGVAIEIELDGEEIILERTIKKGKTISQDYCAITIDGEKREISVSELKSKVLELLGYSQEFAKKQNLVYKFTVYTPQEEMKQIILQDSETRMNTLRHVFGIDKYKTILENSSVIAAKLREEKRLNQGITLNLENDKLELISKIQELEIKNSNLLSAEKEFLLKKEQRKKIQEESSQIFEKVQERNQLKQEIEKTKIMLSNKNQAILENEKTKKILQEQINELRELKFDSSEIPEIEIKIFSAKEKKESLNQKILSVNSQINSLVLKIEEQESLGKKISNLEICPTCLQDVDAVYRANVLNKSHSDIAETSKKISVLEEEKNILQEEIKKSDAEIFSFEKRLSDLKILKIKIQGIEEKQQRLAEIEKSELSVKKDLEFLGEHLLTLEKTFSEFEKFEIDFEEKQKELQFAMNNEKSAEISVAELKKEIEFFSKSIEESREKIKKSEDIRKKLDYITELEDWISRKFMPAVSHIEKNVMAKLKEDFSNLFEKWFCMLVSDSFNVSLRDDFTPVIEQQDYEIDYAYLSGGERTAVALAYRLALNQIINSLSKIKTKDLVILDEPTDGFSEQQLDKMRDVLQELNVSQLIIVSHEQKIESFVENVIRLKKDAGVSRIEE